MRKDPFQLTDNFTPREYQVELLDKAKKQNTIVCLGTGTGKTFIAVMLIKELALPLRKPFEKDGKLTFFVVNNVPLVRQQASVIREHTDLVVGEYQGNLNVDEWTQKDWDEHFKEDQVLVLTAQIFLNLLQHGYLKLSKCNLLILDECHHAVKRHPMREIMRLFDDYAEERLPRVLGLTASIVQRNIKPSRMLETIREMERTMRCTAETTSDLVNLSRYGAQPKELLIEYKTWNAEISRNGKVPLHQCSDFLSDYFFNKNADENENLPDPTKVPLSIITDLLFTFQTMGPWCAMNLANLLLEEVHKAILQIPFPDHKLLLQVCETRLRVFKAHIQRSSKDDGSFAKLIEFTSKKVLRFLEVLETVHQDLSNISEGDGDSIKSPLSALVFVQRRHTAFVLDNFLQEVIKRNSKFSFINSCYITGHASSAKKCSPESSMSFNKQEEVLKKFRMQENNVMIATSVVEEGVDLPKCNLVIRFDFPMQYRSYIQSKGRARHPYSKYVLLVDQAETENRENSLKEFHEIEQILLHKCKDHVMPSSEEVEESFLDELYPPYKPEEGEGKPQVTISSSISLVNKYCSKLPSDTFTRLTPRYKIKIFHEDGEKFFNCTLRFPINSPIKVPVVGEKARSRKLAKMIAALAACKALHQKGELDDHLLPHGKDSMQVEDILSSDEDDAVDGKVTGTTKCRRHYHKRVADSLKDCYPEENGVCYLHVIKMELTCPIPDEQNTRGRQLYDPATNQRCFAILSSKIMPPLCDFPVFTRSGEVNVHIIVSPKHASSYDADELDKLASFHQYTFSNVLRLKKSPMKFQNELAQSDYLIVPVLLKDEDSYSVDWNFVDKIHNQKGVVAGKVEFNKDNPFVFQEDLYKDTVVMPHYRNLDQPQFFYVADVCHHLTPESEFPSQDFSSFKDYYEKKYNTRVTCPNQPLLDVDHTSARLNLLTPRYVNRKGIALPSSSNKTKKAKRENLEQKQILIPELCLIHAFPASLWKKVVCLPSILYRINSILLAEQLRKIIAKDLNIRSVNEEQTWPSLNFGWKSTKVSPDSNVINESDKSSVESAEETDSSSPKNVGDNAEKQDEWTVENKTQEIGVDEVDFARVKVSDYRDDTRSIISDDSFSDKFMDDLHFDDLQILDPLNHFNFPGKESSTLFNISKVLGSKTPSPVSKAEETKLALNYDASTLPFTTMDALLAEEKMEIEPNIYDDIGDITENGSPEKSSSPIVIVEKDRKLNGTIHASNEAKKYGPVQFGELLPNRDERMDLDSDFDVTSKFSFDEQVDLASHPGPSPNVLLQALTMSNANDGINLERLETVGDSFLKYAVSVYLYCNNTEVHEGKLSYFRSKQVSNMNLFRLGKRKNLGEFMVAAKFEPHDNWLAPCYCINTDNTPMFSSPKIHPDSVDEFPNKNGSKNEVIIPYNLLTQHSIPDKSIADCVEALIGAYLTSCGTKSALLLMSWLGMKVLPQKEDGDDQYSANLSWIKPPPSPLSTYITNPTDQLQLLLSGYNKFENLINYSFRDKAYLIQAFTHASYHYNKLTDCYQRLEFLGDAVLDYLITRHLYEDPRQHCPGALTDLRSALVNNTFFASLAVKYQFYKYFKAISPGLYEVINKFVLTKKTESQDHQKAHYDYVTEEDCDELEEDIEVPKALGDIFESVAGAIYLDSGMSLDTVWKVYYAMMKPEIEQFSTNVPKSPIRELLEMEPETAKFLKPKKTIEGKIRVIVEVYGKGKFAGVGRNYRIAKCTAAKRALSHLKAQI